MNEAQFWQIVATAADGDAGVPAEDLVLYLSTLEPDTIRAFDNLFGTLKERAYRWELWGAAYLMNGGCSDDTFSDFRSGLISLGQGVFEAALRDPDSLAELGPEYGDFAIPDEEYGTAAEVAYEDVTGTELYPFEPLDEEEDNEEEDDEDLDSHAPTGERWDFDSASEAKARFPRLFRLFGHHLK